MDNKSQKAVQKRAQEFKHKTSPDTQHAAILSTAGSGIKETPEDATEITDASHGHARSASYFV